MHQHSLQHGAAQECSPTFPERLKKLRVLCGLTQSDLASQLGVSLYTIWKWENGRSFPLRALRNGLCSVLGAEPKDLFEARS